LYSIVSELADYSGMNLLFCKNINPVILHVRTVKDSYLKVI
jgi:hypothetical protein